MSTETVCSLLCPLPQGADQASTGAGRSMPTVGRLLSPAEAVEKSRQGPRHDDSTRCRDGTTQAAWRLAQHSTVRRQRVGRKTR